MQEPPHAGPVYEEAPAAVPKAPAAHAAADAEEDPTGQWYPAAAHAMGRAAAPVQNDPMTQGAPRVDADAAGQCEPGAQEQLPPHAVLPYVAAPAEVPNLPAAHAEAVGAAAPPDTRTPPRRT